MALARMRTKDEAHKQLLIDDPYSAVTKHALYVMMRSGQIPTMRVGTKRLINYDALLAYLANPPQQLEPDERGKIRRLNG